MEITKEGIKRLKRADYLGFVMYTEGIFRISVKDNHVHAALHDFEDGATLATQDWEIDVVDTIVDGRSLEISVQELETRLYSRNLPYLVQLGKSINYRPEKDTILARFFNWLYGKFTKEKI